MDPGYDPIGQSWDPIAKGLGFVRTVERSSQGQQHVMLGCLEGFDVTLTTAPREDDPTAKTFEIRAHFEEAQDPAAMRRGLLSATSLKEAFRAVTEEELGESSLEVGQGFVVLTAALKAPFVLGGQRAVIQLVRSFLHAVSEESAPVFDRCSSCWQNEVRAPMRLSHRTVRLCSPCQEHPAPAVDGARPPLPHILASPPPRTLEGAGLETAELEQRARAAAELHRADEAGFRKRLARWVRLAGVALAPGRLGGKSSTSLAMNPGGLGRYVLAARELPRFFEWLDSLARQAGTPVPDMVVLETGAVAAAVDEPIGLRGHRRMLHIGVPVLDLLHPDELAAVLTHELCHFWQEDELCRETRRTMRDLVTSPALGTNRILQSLLKEILPRGRVLLAGRECEADRVAAKVISPQALATGTLKIRLLEGFWPEAVEQSTWKAAGKGPVPPDDPCALWLESIGELDERQVAYRCARILREKDHIAEIHPPLGERLRALGVTGPVTVAFKPRLLPKAREKLDDFDKHKRLLMTATTQRTSHGFADLHRFSQVLAARATLLRERVAAYPGLRRAFVELAQVSAKLEDAPGAVLFYRKALELDPAGKEAAQELLRLVARRGDPEAALPWLDAVLPDLERDWQLAVPVIELMEVTGRHEPARHLTSRVLESHGEETRERIREALVECGFDPAALQAEAPSPGATPAGAPAGEVRTPVCLVCHTALEAKPHQECPVCHFEVHLECGRAIGGCARLECARAAAPRRRAMAYLKSRVDRHLLGMAAVSALFAAWIGANLAAAASRLGRGELDGINVILITMLKPLIDLSAWEAGKPILGLAGFAFPAMIAWLVFERFNEGRVIRAALRQVEVLCSDHLKILKKYCAPGKKSPAAAAPEPDARRLCELWHEELTLTVKDFPSRTEQMILIGDGESGPEGGAR